MTLGIIVSRPEYITQSNRNRNDKEEGTIKKHVLISHIYVAP